jgi:hypothetical protein
VPSPEVGTPVAAGGTRIGERDWPAVLGLAALAAALVGPALLGRAVFYQRDISVYWYPFISSFVRAVGEGSWPVWNPHTGFGAPFVADPSFQLFYPPTWLTLLLPPQAYFPLFVAGHCLLGALGVRALSRGMGVGRLGAFTAGAAWMCSGPLLSSVSMYHHFAGAAWTPWVLLRLDALLQRRGRWSAAVGLGALASLQALAGSADLCFMTALLGAGLALVRLGRSAERWRSVAAPLGLAVAYAAALAAAQWLPTLLLLRGASRAGVAQGSTLYWSLHPLSLLDLWVPPLTTRMAADGLLSAAARERLFENREPLLASVYLGAPALAAVAWALWGALRRRAVTILALAWMAFVVLALGHHLAPAAWVLQTPPFSLFRFPVKYLLPAALAWSLLAGLGVDAARQAAKARAGSAARRGLALLAAAVVVLAVVAMAAARLPAVLSAADARSQSAALVGTRLAYLGLCLGLAVVLAALVRRGSLSAPLAAAALSVAVVADLAAHGRHVNPLAPPALMSHRPPLMEAMRASMPARVYVQPAPLDWFSRQFVRMPRGWDAGAGWTLGSIDLLWPPLGTRWGLLGSYDGDSTGLRAPAIGRAAWRLQEMAHLPQGVRMLQRGGVDFVVTLHEQPFGGALAPVAEHMSVYVSPVRLFRVPAPLPRAFVVGRARTVADEEGQALLEGEAWDPRREVLLAAEPGGAGPASAEGGGCVGTVQPAWRRFDGLAFDVECDRPGHLVVLEAYDRGWTARVDGQAAPVRRANVLFRAVPVPAGRLRVELSYRAPGLAAGLAVSLLAALAGAAFLAGEARRAGWVWRPAADGRRMP